MRILVTAAPPPPPLPAPASVASLSAPPVPAPAADTIYTRLWLLFAFIALRFVPLRQWSLITLLRVRRRGVQVLRPPEIPPGRLLLLLLLGLPA